MVRRDTVFFRRHRLSVHYNTYSSPADTLDQVEKRDGMMEPQVDASMRALTQGAAMDRHVARKKKRIGHRRRKILLKPRIPIRILARRVFRIHKMYPKHTPRRFVSGHRRGNPPHVALDAIERHLHLMRRDVDHNYEARMRVPQMRLRAV